jgi:hypothetical protein
VFPGQKKGRGINVGMPGRATFEESFSLFFSVFCKSLVKAYFWGSRNKRSAYSKIAFPVSGLENRSFHHLPLSATSPTPESV